MTEAEFYKQLEWLIEETTAAMAVYDVYEEVHKLALERNDLHTAMLADNAFWRVHLGALQNALFGILGRIFDKRKDAHSIMKVIDAAEEHIGFFSHGALAKRKLGIGPKPDWLDDYIPTAWAGDRQTIGALKKSLEPHINRYRDVYEPLRHSYFAHRSLKPEQSVGEMFEQTNRIEIGETITYIRDLAEALRQAYVNGREPVPGIMNYEREREEHRFAVRSVLEKLSQWPFKGSAV